MRTPENSGSNSKTVIVSSVKSILSGEVEEFAVAKNVGTVPQYVHSSRKYFHFTSRVTNHPTFLVPDSYVHLRARGACTPRQVP